MEKGKIIISERNRKEVDFWPPYTKAAVVYSIVLLVATSLVGGGLYWLNYNETNKINNLTSQVNTVVKEIQKRDSDGNLLENSNRINNAVKNYNKYSKEALDWKVLLTNIKDETLKEVTYSSFGIDYDRNNFRIDGVAPSYRVVAEQLNIFKNNKNYPKVNLKAATLRPESDASSRVAFSLELTLSADALKAPKKQQSAADLLKEGISTENDQTTTNIEKI